MIRWAARFATQLPKIPLTEITDQVTLRKNGGLYMRQRRIGRLLLRPGYFATSFPKLGPGLTDRYGRPKQLIFFEEAPS